jgi:beta-galactosidase/beta-glucuronidase
MIRFQLSTACLFILLILSVSFDSYGQSTLDYPQPQFVREHWQSLNGEWDFSFDDQNQGLIQNWQNSNFPAEQSIQVPFVFESALSGIGDRSKHETSWYQKSFELPEDWQGQKVLLHFGAVFYKATVWLNGVKLGEHIGGQTPFSFELNEALLSRAKSGVNKLVVRCEHPQSNQYIARGKQTYESDSVGNYYTRTSGIWQSVWLEAVGTSYVESVHFSVAMNGSGTAIFKLNAPRSGEKIRLTLKGPSGKKQVIQQTITKVTNEVSLPFQIQDPQLWEMAHPILYNAQIDLIDANSEQLDSVGSYFGIREVRTQNGRVTINGKPIYLKFVLDQGFWPESIWTPPSAAALEKDIRVALSMGFNGVRMHQKLEDPRFLYLADRLGLLVSSEFANPLLYSKSATEQFTKEWREAVERDWNHPALIIWVPTNESWGFPHLERKSQQNTLIGNYKLTKSLDPSRLVIDNEGGPHTNFTDLFSVHDYATSGVGMNKELAPLNPKPKAHHHAPPIDYSGWLIDGFSSNRSPLYLSEFGGVRFVMPGDMLPPVGEWETQNLQLNFDQAFERLKDLYAAIAQMPNLTGMCLTQLMDIENETNGMMTYHRVLKFDPTEIKKLNDSLK